MKKAILLFALVAIAAFSQAQAIDKFFEKFADDERFSYAKIGKSMQTLTIEISAANKNFVESLEKEILDIVKKENFEATVESREKGERSYIYSKPAKDKKDSEMVIINRDKKEINILWIQGKGKMVKDMMNLTGEFTNMGELNELNFGNESATESK